MIKPKMAVHLKSETPHKQYKGKWNRHWEGMEKLTKHIKISSKWKFRNNKEAKQEKVFKNKGWPNKTINRNKEKNHIKNDWIERK